MNSMVVNEKDVTSKEILQPTCPVVTTGCRERRAREMLIDEHLKLKQRTEETEQQLRIIQAALEKGEGSKGLADADRAIIALSVKDRLALTEAERGLRRLEGELYAARVETETHRAEKRRLQDETDRLLMLRNMDGSEMDMETKEKQKLLQKLRSEADMLRRHNAEVQNDTSALTGSYNGLAHNHNALLHDLGMLHGAYREMLYWYGRRYPAIAKEIPAQYAPLPQPRRFLALPWARRRFNPYEAHPEMPEPPTMPAEATPAPHAGPAEPEKPPEPQPHERP